MPKCKGPVTGCQGRDPRLSPVLSLTETLSGSCQKMASERRRWEIRGRAMSLEGRIQRRDRYGTCDIHSSGAGTTTRPSERIRITDRASNRP